MAERYRSLQQEKENAKQTMIDMYRRLELFLRNKKYKHDFKTELEISNPDFVKSINKRIEDMEKTDHGIVIAGETSAGKSTLINSILEKIIFKGTTLESTSTICKIRNLERVRIVTENVKGETTEIAQTEAIDINTKPGVEKLRSTLSTLVDKTPSENFKALKCVDVGFPIPFLQGNTILVDTPGIGGTKEFTNNLMNYLPNAVSFIFVISVERGGGMQDDRLPMLLKSINELRKKDDMICFDPEDVIFITNKWDSVKSQLDVEEEKELLWEKLKKDIKSKWPFVREEHIFRMNTIEVRLEGQKENRSTNEFKKFRKALFANVKKAENIRNERHFRYLLNLLENVSKGLHARLHLQKQSADSQKKLTALHLQTIEDLKCKCGKIKTSVLKKIKQTIEDIANNCYENMSNPSEKEKILNPGDRPRLMSLTWIPELFVDEINKRIIMYVNDSLQSEQVLRRFEDLKNEIVTFYRDVVSDLSAIENQWTNAIKSDGFGKKERNEDAIYLSDIPLPIKIPLVALTVLGAAVLAVLVSPVLLVGFLFFGRDEKKREIIDEVYNQHQAKVRDEIRQHLEKNCGDPLNDLVENVTNDLLLTRIKFLENLIKALEKTRDNILMSINSLEELKTSVDDMKMSAENIQDVLLDTK